MTRTPYCAPMNRHRFLLTSLAGALAPPLATGAQAGTVHRIVEGRSFVFEHRALRDELLLRFILTTR